MYAGGYVLLDLVWYILFYFILFYFILFYFILFYFILFYFIYFILFYFILFILFYFILFYLFYFIYFILFYFILFWIRSCQHIRKYVPLLVGSIFKTKLSHLGAVDINMLNNIERRYFLSRMRQRFCDLREQCFLKIYFIQ